MTEIIKRGLVSWCEMTKFLRSYISQTYAIPYARVLASQGRYDAAIKTLERAFKFSSDKPDIRTPVAANALLADLLYRIDEKHKSFGAIQVVLGIINKKSKLSKSDRDYIEYKMKWLASCLTSYSDSEAFETALAISLTYDNLDIGKVSKYLTRLFPLTEDQGREFDRSFLANMQGGRFG